MSRVAVIEGNEIKYHVMDPTGNITILVETPVEEASQPFVASKLMEAEPEAEQVGFLTSPVNETWDIALRMAGGEFCGNATMSAAAFYAAGAGIEKGIVTVCVSGAAQPVPVELCVLPDGGYCGTVIMPRPAGIKEVRLPAAAGQIITCPVVHFEGIDHVILEERPVRDCAEALAPVWCRELNTEAVGLMFLNRSQEAAETEQTKQTEQAPQTDGVLTPLVYVPEADTLVWENSCASGTSAVGAWAASVQKKEDAETCSRTLKMTLQEPGGVLSVEVGPSGEIRLTGTVREQNC